MIQGSTIIMGDLNTVRTQLDLTSRKLDTTSSVWNSICSDFDLQEPQGSNFYTYQHPTLPRQSHIDYVVGPKSFMDNLYMNGWWSSLSDHQVLVASLLPDLDRGPGLWCFPDNLLEDSDFVTMVNALL